MAVMYIIRGVPGSGKSTLADILAREWGATVCEADDYFYDENNIYKFDKDKLIEAHAHCFGKAYDLVRKKKNLIISNTSSTLWEAGRYIKLGKDFGYEIQIITLQSTFENDHCVPEEVVEKYRKKFEYTSFDIYPPEEYNENTMS